jgi:hypothetical protein
MNHTSVEIRIRIPSVSFRLWKSVNGIHVQKGFHFKRYRKPE